MYAGQAWPMLIRFSVPFHHWTWLIVLHPVRLFADSPVFVIVTAMLFICCPRSAHWPGYWRKRCDLGEYARLNP